MKKIIVPILAIAFGIIPAAAQTTILPSIPTPPFSRFEGGIVVGSTGMGFELITPLADFVQLRAGYTFVPNVQLPISVTIPGADAAPTYDDEGEPIPNTFDRMSGLLQDVTGCTVDDRFTVVATPRFRHFRLMADFYPLPTFRHWHLTAGFLWGTSTIGTFVNAPEEAPLLVAFNAYNRMYDKAYNDDPLISYGDFDLYNLTLNQKLLDHGRLGVEMGRRVSDNTPFLLEPDDQGTIRGTIQVNAFKPYVGTGYEGYLSPRSQDWIFSVELGALLWGGAPRVLTSDRVRTLTEKVDEYDYTYTEWDYSTTTLDLVRDVRDIPGRPGQMISLVRRMKVYPVLEFRLSYRLF